jgi:hypothetical protein
LNIYHILPLPAAPGTPWNQETVLVSAFDAAAWGVLRRLYVAMDDAFLVRVLDRPHCMYAARYTRTRCGRLDSPIAQRNHCVFDFSAATIRLAFSNRSFKSTSFGSAFRSQRIWNAAVNQRFAFTADQAS